VRRGIAGPGFFAFSERYLDCTSFVFEAYGTWPSRLGFATMFRLSAVQVSEQPGMSFACTVTLRCGKVTHH
jgi:hypothetical protein